MSEKIRFLYDADTWDAATISSSSEAGDLVDDNAVHDFVAKPWRTTGDSAEWIKFDLGSAQQITCFCLFGFNLTWEFSFFLYPIVVAVVNRFARRQPK